MIGIFKKYINKRIELLKLELSETTANIASMLIVTFIALTIAMMFLFLASLAIGLFIGKWLDNLGLGILVFSLVYLIAFIILIINYKGLRKFIMKKIIEFQLNDKEIDENDDQD